MPISDIVQSCLDPLTLSRMDHLEHPTVSVGSIAGVKFYCNRGQEWAMRPDGYSILVVNGDRDVVEYECIALALGALGPFTFARFEQALAALGESASDDMQWLRDASHGVEEKAGLPRLIARLSLMRLFEKISETRKPLVIDESLGRRCRKCGQTSAQGAMFTTCPPYCDDCT